MDELFLLYETDEWISDDSKLLLGVFTTEGNLLEHVRDYVSENLRTFRDDEDDIEEDTIERVVQEFCDNNLQTQGYDTNLYAESVEPNEWIEAI